MNDDFDTAGCTFKVREAYAYCYIDPRWLIGQRDDDDRLPHFHVTMFRTEAENRGYCMKLWDAHVPRGLGAVQYDGRIA